MECQLGCDNIQNPPKGLNLQIGISSNEREPFKEIKIIINLIFLLTHTLFFHVLVFRLVSGPVQLALLSPSLLLPTVKS